MTEKNIDDRTDHNNTPLGFRGVDLIENYDGPVVVSRKLLDTFFHYVENTPFIGQWTTLLGR
jgi:hypothetical protein